MGRSYISSGGSSTRAPSCTKIRFSIKHSMSQYSLSSVTRGGGRIKPHASALPLVAPKFLVACAFAATSAFQMLYPVIPYR